MPELMDKVIDNLWIGGLAAALDGELLRQNGIKSVLSVMRGRVAIQKTFIRHQILLDDTDEADALVHFPACISWIDSEIKKGRGVLVHCQAGMSRSATIIAAYLMYTKNIDVGAALDIIREARPVIEPNEGFIAQLAVFHSAHYKRTRRNKETRAFYVERAVKEVLNGDGSSLEMDMFAKYPRSPADSTPNTPYPQPRRRLRCKMCRQELATREHMIDHGQVGPATPATGYTLSPAVSRRPSAGEAINISRRGSTNTAGTDSVPPARRLSGSVDGRRSSFGAAFAPMTPINPQETQAPTEASRKPSFSALAPMTPIVTQSSQASAEPSTTERERRASTSDQPEVKAVRRKSLGSNPFGGLSMTPMPSTTVPASDRRPSSAGRGSTGSGSGARPRRRSLLGLGGDDAGHVKDNQSTSALESDDDEGEGLDLNPAISNAVLDGTIAPIPSGLPSPALASPQELAAHIHPGLAALRSSPLISALSSSGSLGMTPVIGTTGPSGKQRTMSATSPPLLMPTAKCSGYFVEPMKWMEPFLESGNMAGKIICPNKKCAAKLGNYDWAGVCCSCKEWVVPGFCIHKSKVDEIVI